jgi:8-oxo-dGTP diphosphatase
MATRTRAKDPAVPPADGPPRFAVAVDVVLLALRDERLSLLLIRRGVDPFRGAWALPGGFVLERESLEAAAARELEEEAGVRRAHLAQFGVYGDPERDPRGRVISVAYVGLVRADERVLRAATDADAAAWFPFDDPPRLAFDHARIVADARAHLRERLDREPVGAELLPEAFSLAALQRVHEAVLGLAIDKRNFRRKVIGDGLVEPVDGEREEGAHRPAQLYRWAGRRG